MLLHLSGEPDLAQEGDDISQPAEGRNRLGRFVQNQLGIAEERGNFGAGRFVQGRVGLFNTVAGCRIARLPARQSSSQICPVPTFAPGGWKPPSTSGRMPDATDCWPFLVATRRLQT
jgi:hypothetical protein